MKTHYKSGDPTASKLQVELEFETMLPSESNVYIRRLRLAELHQGHNTSLPWYGAFDADGNQKKDVYRVKAYISDLKRKGYTVHLLH